MKYRHFGKLDIKPSLLGFGAMRLPQTDPADPKSIDIAKAVEMIRAGIDGGINYVDTAYVYHGEKSEELVGLALKDGYREKAYVATKNPTWLIEKPGDFTKYLDIQLERLDTDHIDFYLQHSFTKERFELFKKHNVWQEAMAAKDAGKITYFGFSFHDGYEVFEEIINGYDWDFCQIQYNFLDEEFQAGTKGLKLAASKNMGVVVMEPLRGGKMGDKMPEDIKAEFDKYNFEKPSVELALRWVANHPEVSLLLSGMHTMDQVKENLAICSMEDILPGKALTDKEISDLLKLAATWNKRTLVSCTGCNYCMPCPAGVNIPQCFSTYNYFGSNQWFAEHKAKEEYKSAKEKKEDGSHCVKCGQCAAVCPQSIPIPEKLEELDKAMS